MASNFANHSYRSCSEHLPDALHCSEVLVEFGGHGGALEPTFVAGCSGLESPAVPIAPIAVTLDSSVQRLPVRAAVQWGTINTTAGRHDSFNVHNITMTSAGKAIDPWPLLRNDASDGGRRGLHLVVHGRTGGAVPDCLASLPALLAERRSAPVQLEVLTAENPVSALPLSSWIVPLLLLPGAHVRTDVPAIRDRLLETGASVSLLPFLGAWTSWWNAVLSALPVPDRRDAVLVHHPLRPGVADRFLTMLSSRMALPLVPFDACPAFQQLHPRAWPLPLALAPNRMTEALSEAGGLPPLLEYQPTRQALIDLLVSLP